MKEEQNNLNLEELLGVLSVCAARNVIYDHWVDGKEFDDKVFEADAKELISNYVLKAIEYACGYQKGASYQVIGAMIHNSTENFTDVETKILDELADSDNNAHKEITIQDIDDYIDGEVFSPVTTLSLMEEWDLDAKAIANIAGVDEAVIYDILNNKRDITKEIASALAARFKVSLEAFGHSNKEE